MSIARVEAPHLPGPLPALDELAFIPRDVEAVVRADLAGLTGSDPGFAYLWPSALAHERPELVALLARADIDFAADVDRLYVALGRDFGVSGAYLAALSGRFDEARVAAALTTAGLAAHEVDGVRVWRVRLAEGSGGVVLAPGLVVAGALPLVERSAALLAAAARGEAGTGAAGGDVRDGPLGEELAGLDPEAHGWVVARLGAASQARLGQEAAGLTGLRLDFQRRDGRVRLGLRAAFADAGAARAAEQRLRALTASAERTAARLGLLELWLGSGVRLDLARDAVHGGTVITARTLL
ncbi:MAG: hypothetical protein IT370_11270 [Deltaproteobacteria bacterium]|nr:hypothetical protein [Deltaproteobacteria bacterium]